MNNEKVLMEKYNRALSIVSHDLKSPMVAIIGFSELLSKQMEKEKPLNPKWLDMQKRISNAGRDMLALIENILAMAKMEAGKEEVKPEWIYDIPKELSEIQKIFEYEAKSKGIGFSIKILSPLPTVRWDMKRLRYHVLNNLISNALKFTPSGGSVTLSAEADRDTVFLRIADTGHGIPPDEQEKIFHRFEQLDSNMHRVSKGMGLGLYNARLFVTQHGGRLSLDSSVNSGAAFVIELPIDSLRVAA